MQSQPTGEVGFPDQPQAVAEAHKEARCAAEQRSVRVLTRRDFGVRDGSGRGSRLRIQLAACKNIARNG
jgi:protein-disulfide isomerase